MRVVSVSSVRLYSDSLARRDCRPDRRRTPLVRIRGNQVRYSLRQ